MKYCCLSIFFFISNPAASRNIIFDIFSVSSYYKSDTRDFYLRKTNISYSGFGISCNYMFSNNQILNTFINQDNESLVEVLSIANPPQSAFVKTTIQRNQLNFGFSYLNLITEFGRLRIYLMNGIGFSSCLNTSVRYETKDGIKYQVNLKGKNLGTSIRVNEGFRFQFKINKHVSIANQVLLICNLKPYKNGAINPLINEGRYGFQGMLGLNYTL